ncbi:MAG: hypothetical protein BGO25_06420 [Acidobacteriales bacterium 59-55]|nr:MAG: hypothetical protein ABT04_00035 [Granulicella sp. SCN 62-9]OJV43400.1 MAG: hypothetical protein BGO25_06420 [Acidobacteriales bacterium 59-55]
MHARQAVSGSASAPVVDSDTQTPMTKAQAKELFRSVDTILKFVSSDTQLPIEHPVKRKLVSREQVNHYLTKKFDEDENTKRLERSEIVLKKFGLLDRDFNLRPFLVSLLTEQIAGFYDNQSKTVNLLNWIPPDQQKPVLAHELTHALQDQRVGLTKWSDITPEGTAHDVHEDNHHIELDEANTARDAVAEGQAMAVFVDYTLRPSGKTLADAPELADRLNDLIADSSGSPIMSRAPLLLQQSLLFPYSAGLSFEQSILVKKGVKAAFADVLAKPPSSSFEIMNPKAYMAHTSVPVVRLPDIHPLLDAEYTPYDVGVMGELDVRILAELFGGRQIATALAPAWDGGIYYAAQRKSAVTAAEKASTASIGLLYYSRWKNADSARSFLRVYASQIPRKYSGVVRRSHDEVNPADGEEQVYSTSEGDVLLSLSGDGVFISEGFELPLARKLRDRIVSEQPQGPLQIARAGMHEGTHEPHELSLGLARTLSSFGIIRAGVPQRYTFEGRPNQVR